MVRRMPGWQPSRAPSPLLRFGLALPRC
eukprot:SAG31_NODE_20584_length_570_cov_0.872611_1_plen_27_part_01